MSASASVAAPSEGSRLLPVLLALLAFAPNPRAAWPGLSYYFRDFTLTHMPLRAAFAESLRAGSWPFWEPRLYEGCAMLPLFYPTELLLALWSGPAAASWLLTLHFPLAALGMYALARELGACRPGGFGAGAVFALGGLALSSLNLWFYFEALALAPLVVLMLRRAALRGGRSVAVAAAAIGLCLTTLALEAVLQALALGLALALSAAPTRRGLSRALAAGLLGAALAGLPVALVLGIVRESVRSGEAFAATTLQGALHPLALGQLLIPDFFGSTSEPLRTFWGGRLFLEGSPYFLTLYLGPVALALAPLGLAALPRRERIALVLLGLLGLLVALGALAPLLAPLLPGLRFPVKALLLPHFVAALGAGLAITRLRRGEAWPRLGWGAATLGFLALLPFALVGVFDATAASWLDISPYAAAAMVATLARQGGAAAGIGLLAGLLAFSAARARMRIGRASTALLALLSIDLVRGGTGVNPQTTPRFFEALPEMRAALGELGDGRLFSFDPSASRALRARIAAHVPGIDLWSFFIARQTLAPFANLLGGVSTAEGLDRTSFIPNPVLLKPWEHDPGALDAVLPRLRNAAVRRLVSLDALAHSQLVQRAQVPTGLAGVEIHVYDIVEPWPRAYVACRRLDALGLGEATRAPLLPGFDPRRDVALHPAAQGMTPTCSSGAVVAHNADAADPSYSVSADGPGFLVVRDSYTPSLGASVDGQPTPLLRANGRHRAVPVPAGSHEVRIWYEPPGLRVGALLSASAALACLVVLLRGGRACP